MTRTQAPPVDRLSDAFAARQAALDAAFADYNAGQKALWADLWRRMAEADAAFDREVIAARADYDQRLVGSQP